MTNIEVALRVAVTAASLATTLALHRALFRDDDPSPEERRTRRRAGLLLGAVAAIATGVSHFGTAALADVLPRIFPVGLLGGLALAIGSLFVPTLRRAFDRMRDADVRMIVGTRAAFGSLLIGFGGLGLLPASFAMSAGLGDILVATAIIGAPGAFDRTGPRGIRAVVHGIGILDMAMVISQAILVVRPFALEHPGRVTSMTLPWLVVPLMVAMDLHGLRKVFATQPSGEPVRDGSEPARDVRRAVP